MGEDMMDRSTNSASGGSLDKLSQRNLQNHSFRGQDLSGVDLSGANLRGADFQQAILRGACLQEVIVGRSLRQWIVLIVTVAIAVGLSGDAVSRLLFAALGQAMEDTAGQLVILLHTLLMLAGAGALFPSPRRGQRWSSCFVGALVGFFYGSQWFGVALPPAMMGAAVGAVGAWGLTFGQSESRAIALTTAATVTTTGTAYLLGTTAIATAASLHGLALPFTGLTIFYLGCTWRWSSWLMQALQQFGGTSFRETDLTDATFTPANMGLCHFTGAIAPPAPSSQP